MPVKYDLIVFIKNKVPLRMSSFQAWFLSGFSSSLYLKTCDQTSLVHPFASILIGDFLFVHRNSHTRVLSSFWFSFVAELQGSRFL